MVRLFSFLLLPVLRWQANCEIQERWARVERHKHRIRFRVVAVVVLYMREVFSSYFSSVFFFQALLSLVQTFLFKLVRTLFKLVRALYLSIHPRRRVLLFCFQFSMKICLLSYYFFFFFPHRSLSALSNSNTPQLFDFFFSFYLFPLRHECDVMCKQSVVGVVFLFMCSMWCYLLTKLLL